MVVGRKQLSESLIPQRSPLAVRTHEQPAAARSAPERSPAPPTPPAGPSTEDMTELMGAMRSFMLQVRSRQRSAEQGGEHGRVAVLFTLAKVGPMRASALAKECLLDLSTVSRHLRALEDEGHVAKSADPDDKRAFQVGLTERGHDFVRQYWRDRISAIQAALSDSAWSADDVRALAKLLDRFVRDTEGCFK